MKTSHVLMLCATLLLIGLVNALIIAQGINRFNQTFQYKDFYSSSRPLPPPNVIVLSQKRFAVVREQQISIYEIDEKGKLKRTDDVETIYQQLQPSQRVINPPPQAAPTSFQLNP